MAPYPRDTKDDTLAAHSENGNTLTFGCDRWPLHYACRTGNLENVKYLVNVAKIPIDEQDAHDATPLYLAALTGHNEICRFLLESGAKCDPDSGGDAARVFYVALTPELRRLLREWSLTAASRDPFVDLLRRTFNDPVRADTICYSLEDSGNSDGNVYCHRILLLARCPELAQYVVERKGLPTPYELCLPPPMTQQPTVTRRVLEYLYTGVLEVRDVEYAGDAQDIATQLSLTELKSRLDTAIDRHVKLENNPDKQSNQSTTRFRCDISNLPAVREEMRELAKLVSTPHQEIETMEVLNELVEGSDLTVKCQDCSWSLHAFLLCAQSEYFLCALSGGFREAQEAFVDLSHLVPSPEAVQFAIQWLYCDRFILDEDEVVDLEVALCILELGSVILCPRLVAYTSNTVLIPAVELENVFDMLELSRHYNLDKLEDQCVVILAANLSTIAHEEAFKGVISREAKEIVQSGDVRVADVPIAAELRSAISKREELSREEREHLFSALQQIVNETIHPGLV